MKARWMKAAGAIAAMTTVGIAFAQAIPPDRAIKYRQAILSAMNYHMRLMNAEIKGDRPFSKDDFLMRATYVDQLAHMPWEAFAPGTEQGAPNKAKPELWKDPAKFKQYQEQLVAQTQKLVTAARSANDASGVRAAFGDVDKACNNCHDDFRAK